MFIIIDSLTRFRIFTLAPAVLDPTIVIEVLVKFSVCSFPSQKGVSILKVDILKGA